MNIAEYALISALYYHLRDLFARNPIGHTIIDNRKFWLFVCRYLAKAEARFIP